MTYETQWKTVVDDEWEKYKKKWETNHPGEKLDETRLTFMASFMRQKYQKESEDVQEKVKERREELKQEINAEEDGNEKKSPTRSNECFSFRC